MMFSSVVITTALIKPKAKIYLAFMCCGLFPSTCPLRFIVADLPLQTVATRRKSVYYE